MELNQIIECVPNISEGQDTEVLKAVKNIITSTESVGLLDVDSGKSVNRSVFTFIGQTDKVLDVAFEIIRFVTGNLDMRRHRGVHPRLGLVDVCPFIPVKNITAEQLNKKVWKFGKKVGYELNVPVFFYELSAIAPDRQKLETIRRGEYEMLSDHIYTGRLVPDVAPLQFNFKTGGVVTGTRNFLIAFNVNLLTTDLSKAKTIARRMREIRDNVDVRLIFEEKLQAGKSNRLTLKYFKVIGWNLEDYNQIQVSFNFTNHHITPVHLVYELLKEISAANNVALGESELIGLIPISALAGIAKAKDMVYSNNSELIEQTFNYLQITGKGATSVINDQL